MDDGEDRPSVALLVSIHRALRQLQKQGIVTRVSGRSKLEGGAGWMLTAERLAAAEEEQRVKEEERRANRRAKR
jgi:hypothetical protein